MDKKKQNSILKCWVAFVVMCIMSGASVEGYWFYIPFDVSMKKNRYPKAIATTKAVMGIDGEVLYFLFADLFDNNNISRLVEMNEDFSSLRIPKRIHQIWLGSLLPDVFKSYVASWKKYEEQGWTYTLWTDKEVETLELENRDLYDAATNYGEKSDILRYELIYQFGGVYVDIDNIALRDIEVLHYAYDFYIGMQPLDSLFVQVGTGIFGARSHHPIVKKAIEGLRHNQDKPGIPARSGPVYFTQLLYHSLLAYDNEVCGRCIVLPGSYLYPLGCRDSYTPAYLEKPEAYAIHLWSKSWMDPKYRPPQFRTLSASSASD
ncbi:MAG: glycosyltransferase [Candidatus Babeliales bacterium]